MTATFGLPRAARVLGSRDFKRIYAQGSRARGKLMTIVVRARQGGGTRLGLSVSKDHGPAVRRNKIKRILREAFRIERPAIEASADVVVIPVVREQKLVLAAARAELRSLLQQIASGRGRGPRGAR